MESRQTLTFLLIFNTIHFSINHEIMSRSMCATRQAIYHQSCECDLKNLNVISMKSQNSSNQTSDKSFTISIKLAKNEPLLLSILPRTAVESNALCTQTHTVYDLSSINLLRFERVIQFITLKRSFHLMSWIQSSIFHG